MEESARSWLPDLPREIETDRLLLTQLGVGNASELFELVMQNREYLSEWMPWARSEDVELSKYQDLMREWDDLLEAKTDFHYGIRLADSGDLIGNIGIHARIAPRALDVGYWVSEPEQGNGYVTEATESVTKILLKQPGIDRVEICHEPGNLKSRAIPQRLGFTEVGEKINREGLLVRIWAKVDC